nr:hypothetical protein [Tanacetum cinerariifolium]
MVQKYGIQCYNCKEYGHVARECQKSKREKDATYHREKMLLCKQEEVGIQLNAEQADWKDDTDNESDDQELEAHYMYMTKLQQVSPDAVDSGPIFDKEPEQKVQNDDHYDVFAIEYLDPTKDLHPPFHVNPLSGGTTYSYSPNQLREMLTDEHDLDYSSPLLYDEYDDDLQFDIESDLKEIEYLLHQDIDSSLKDLIDQKVESDAENVYDDPFDSKGEKIKESKLLIDELDLPCDFLPSEYDSFISQDFSRVDTKPSTNNEDKVFNPGILIQEKYFEVITRVVQDKKLATSNASLVLEDFDPPFYEPLFFKEVPRTNMLLLFSSEIEEKVFKPGIHTSKKVHSSPAGTSSETGLHVPRQALLQVRHMERAVNSA